ncbi:MAG: domain S-box/diguanylate cyclase protein [Bacillota bacterium]|nr:domain S-box/diguanylate cyclase protein [Bacillota bacterium]
MLHEDMKKNYKDLVEAHDFAHIGSWEMDVLKNISRWSEEAYRIYGISSKQYDGTYEGFINMIHPEDRAMVDNKITGTVSELTFDIEYRIIRPDGTIRNLRQLIIPIYNQEGKLIYLYGNIQDITGMLEFQTFLGKTEETIDSIQKRFQVLVQQSSDVFEIISPDYSILYISPAIEKITGVSPEQRIGKNALEFLEGEQKQSFIRKVEHVLDFPEERSEGDLILKNPDGEEHYLTYTMSNQLSEPSIQGIVINWRDITDRIDNQKEIEFIATHDELTKLPNRVYLKRKMTQLCEECGPDQDFALIMLDIDGFRYVNDALGYQLGDQLILQVAERLKEILGEERFICRYSGDQFAIIVQNLHKSWEYEQIVKKIASLFTEAYKVDLYELDMTVSLGISMYPNDEKDPDLLINYANISLLRSKHEGKNRYKFYSSDIGIQIYKQVVLRNDLLKAIERNQFRVYYQAQVRLESNDILAAEALIRWEHPEWGMVSPNEFISLAEESGFIINLGNWMLREVCRNYRKWMEGGMAPIKVSVNYSSIQFFERNFVENILNIIEEYGLNPHFLIMEITESVFMKNPEKAILDIKRLQSEGIQVALDDFGTGFSSLSYLNSFNIDILKIDRSFIKNVMLDEASTIITRSVIDLAQELRIKLVAEGIENWDQLAYLRDLNCYSGQGFLYNKPMPISDFEQLLVCEKCLPTELLREKEENRDKRKYLRIKLPTILEADMSIVEIPGQKFKVGKIRVEIKNIGSEGLCFTAGVRLPVNRELTLQFAIPMKDGTNVSIAGFPIWVQELEENCYEYGVEFEHRPTEKVDLTMALYTLCKEMYS